MLTQEKSGFTIIEVLVALVILSFAVLGLAGSATSLTTAAATAETRAQALYAAQDRISMIAADPGYDDLDDYDGTENDTPAPGYTRVTTVTHVTSNDMDFKLVTVVVHTPESRSFERVTVVAAP